MAVGKIIFHGLVLAFLLTGLYDVFSNHEENRCEMSYMYETPQYKQVPMPKEITAKYPRYGLYLYGEGHNFRVASDLKLEGIPVLYIPGNGGSMKQCRSVASFLLRKAEDRQWNPHFNVFTVNLNEELVAFYGGTLNEQTQFVHHSIKAILKLYKESATITNKPQSVVLVGHSMGGIVAKGVFTLSDFDTKSVEVIYTLATPHIHPVFSIDNHIAEFYKKVNSYWNENCDILKDISLVSVSGGDRDFQIDGAVTKFPSCLNSSISTSTTAVPGAWVSADHQCAVWCKQIVLALTRSLFDMVDSKTGQMSQHSKFRSKVLQHHFLHNSGISRFPEAIERSKVKLVETYEVKHITESEWSSVTRDNPKTASYYFFNFDALMEKGKDFAIARSSISSQKWVLACESTNCRKAVDLSSEAYLTPSFKVAKFNIEHLLEDGFSVLVFKVPKQSQNTGQIDVNFLSAKELSQEYTVPHMFSNLWTFDKGFLSSETMGNVKGRFYHRVTLSGLYSIFHAYKITLHPVGESEVLQNQLFEVELPNHQGYLYSAENYVTIKLKGTAGSSVPILHIYTDGETEFHVNIKVQFVQLLGQIVRFTGVVIPTMIALNAMLGFSYQLKMMLQGKNCLTTYAAHEISAKPYKVQPFINLVKKLYTYEWFFVAWHYIGLPVPDAVRLDDDFSVWFTLMPLVTFLYGVEIYLALLFLEMKFVQITAAIFGKFLKPSSGDNVTPSLVSTTVHTVILAVLASQAAGLAFAYIVFLNFIDLSALHTLIPTTKREALKNGLKNSEVDTSNNEKENKNTENSSEKNTEDETPPLDPVSVDFYVKLSMQMLWVCLMVPEVPSLIAMWKGYRSPSVDPSLAPAIFASILFTLHRQQDASVQPTVSRRLICRLLYPVTIVASIVCLYSLHRLPYYILSFLSVYVAMQYFG